MRRSYALALGLAIAAAALPAAGEDESKAAPAPPAPTAAPQAEDGDRDEIVCRKEAPTGSRIPQRVCRKRSDLEGNAAAGRELLNRRKHGSSGG
jgi:hypothetical protein